MAGILTVFSMMLDDAVDQRLIPTNPVHRRRRRGRDHSSTRAEKVFAMPEHVLRIADQATTLGGPSAGLLVITAAWTGCRWGELAGLQRDHVHLDRSVIVIDPEFGALHESAHSLWLGHPHHALIGKSGVRREALRHIPGAVGTDWREVCGSDD